MGGQGSVHKEGTLTTRAKKKEPAPKRPIGRPPTIKGTDHQDLIDQCLAAGWTSEAISLFLRVRYGKDVAGSSIRRYWGEERGRILDAYPELVAADQERVYVRAHQSSHHFVDTLGSIGELIRLQRERLEVGLRLEQATAGFLVDGNRHEIRLLADLVEQYHAILQDWGVVPKAGVDVQLRIDGATPTATVTDHLGPVIDILDPEDQAKVIDLARVIHDRAALPSGA
jgi:hypothetical protein